MFFNGMSRTATNGEIAYLKNPNKIWNLALSMQLQKASYEKYPGFTRKIYVKGYRYNLHYRKRSLLVEVGAQTNTVEEAYRAMRPLADLLEAVLK
jgi:stage II sporulation protein P